MAVNEQNLHLRPSEISMIKQQMQTIEMTIIQEDLQNIA
jgi:hypothetical protein